MYCNQCGNMIPPNGAFCTFCGAKSEATAPMPAPAATAPMASALAMPPAAQAVSEVHAAPVNESIPLTQNEQNEKPEKYYTTKHIVLCLVIAGVMAAAAGVFAGLYFSVI